MANHASAKKKIRQIVRRTASNRDRLSRIRTFIKKVEAAIAAGDKSVAQDALKSAQPEMMQGVQKGVVHKNMVSRKLSRLSSRIKSMNS